MVSWTVILLFVCVCGPSLRPGGAAPIVQEDNENERSYKRELELLTNEVVDDWEHDDNEYLSRRELNEEKNAESKIADTSHEEQTKRWVDVDSMADASPKQSPAADEKLPKDGEIFQGDIVMDTFVREVFNGEASKRDAVNMRRYYWPKKTVYYEFDPDIDRHSREEIEKAISNYHTYTCIKFVPKWKGRNVLDFVRFISNGSACYSNVGRRGGMQLVSIGSGCYRLGTPIHELMHVLGFFHEMSRPDRDESVKINWQNIEERLKHNFRKIPEPLDRNLIEYNIDSVMHYRGNAFSKNGLSTITFLDDEYRTFGQRKGFTVGDVVEINKLYNCPELNSRRLLKNRSYHDILPDVSNDTDQYD